MRKELLITTSILISLSAGGVQAACVTAPSCTEMGFTRTASECPNGSVKCPWNTSLVYCKDNRPSCQIGWVYFEDNTCSAENPGNKKALGVVVYVNPDGIGGQVMASKSIGNYWWGDSKTDLPGLRNKSTEYLASQDFDSCANTKSITYQGDSSVYAAAWAAKEYAPTAKTKGKWCLPAAGVMTSINSNIDKVQQGLSRINGINGEFFPHCCPWSSTEFTVYGAWRSTLNNSYGIGNDGKYGNQAVFPVLEFQGNRLFGIKKSADVLSADFLVIYVLGFNFADIHADFLS